MGRNTDIQTRSFSDAGAKEIKATWDGPAIWKTGDTGSDVWAALWADRSDTDYKLGKDCWDGDTQISGTMPNRGGANYILTTSSQNVAAGYHNRSGVVSSLGGNAGAGQVLTGYTFSSDSAGRAQSGAMPNRGAATYEAVTSNLMIAAGYHNGAGYCTGDPDIVDTNIRSGANIHGVAGNANVVNTSSGTVSSAAHLKSGHVAWSNGSSYTGNRYCQDNTDCPNPGSQWYNCHGNAVISPHFTNNNNDCKEISGSLSGVTCGVYRNDTMWCECRDGVMIGGGGSAHFAGNCSD